VTEVQAGSAVHGDVTYTEWGAQTEPGLFILASVVSRPISERAVVDAGRKAMNKVEITWEVQARGRMD